MRHALKRDAGTAALPPRGPEACATRQATHARDADLCAARSADGPASTVPIGAPNGGFALAWADPKGGIRRAQPAGTWEASGSSSRAFFRRWAPFEYFSGITASASPMAPACSCMPRSPVRDLTIARHNGPYQPDRTVNMGWLVQVSGCF